MNILEHDCEEKFYHEYGSSKLTRGGRSNEEDTTSTSTTTSSISSSNTNSSSTSFNGLHHSSNTDFHPQFRDEICADNIEISSSSTKERSEIGTESSSPNSRMDGEITFDDSCNSAVTNNTILVESVSDIVNKQETDSNSSSAVFTCEYCGKASFKNGEFQTIKLGDIFTQITQFPSSGEEIHEGPRLCAQCLKGHTTGSSTVHHQNNIQHTNNSNRSNISSISNNCKNNSNEAVVVTSSPVGDDGKSGITLSDEQSRVEGSGQFLQGVSTIIMQNSNTSSHHQHQLHQLTTQTSNMHQEHQQQHFYQQQGHSLQQVKVEPDSMVLSQPNKLDPGSMDHSQQRDHQQSLQPLDGFMMHESDMSAMYQDNNESLQQQQPPQTMVSFDDHHNMHQLQQQRQQVICDNQQQQHQSIQHITLVTPGSDIKYTIPTAIMQMQGKEQGGVDQGQGQQHLIQFTGQNHPGVTLQQHHSNGSSTNANSDNYAPEVFQFLDMNTLSSSSSNAKSSLPPLLTTSVVTHTTASTTSSITTTPDTTIMTTNSKSSAKPRSTKNDPGGNSASGPSASGASSKKANNAQKQKPESPKIPCDLCKKKFKNPKMAMNHYRRVHQKEPRFICEICGAVFSYRDSLDCHQVSHRPQEKTHDCAKCGMKFSTKANLRSHTRTHTENPKKFPCEFCPSGFSKRVNLRYHIKRKHPEEAEKMNNNNNSKDNMPAGSLGGGGGIAPPPLHGTLSSHVNSTTTNPGEGSGGGAAEAGDNSKDKNQGSFKCEHCDRAFLFKNNLKAHLRTHTRDKKYTCELCGKSFIYKESLKNHMLLHSNELPYLCEICGKKFRDRSNRRKHVKNVHKYCFVNGDINNPLKTAAGQAGQPGSGTDASSSATTQTGEPPTKKRKNSKKATAAATAASLQQEGASGELVTIGIQDEANNKPRTIIKSPAAPRGKKAKVSNVIGAGVVASSVQPKPAAATSNAKSVIVSASTTSSVGVDRKIIMSPSPKTPKAVGSSGVSSPNSLDYVHSHSSLPATVHVPLASNSQGQFSHGGRSIIVKASSTGVPPNHHQSPPALSPEIYHHPHQQQHGRGPASMQQNVIVYPKPKVIPDHPQQYPSSSSSVISQTMQQVQHQYYVNPDQHHHSHSQQPPQGYSYLQLTSHNQQPSPVQSSLMSHSHLSSPNPSAFEYVLGSTNLSSQDGRGNDHPSGPGGGGPTQSHHPYSGGPLAPEQQQQQQPMDIQIKSEYSQHHFYSQDPNSLAYEQPHYHHHHWTSAPPGIDHGGGHPPSSSSPYQQLVAPPVGSNSSSSGLVNEGGTHPPNSLAQSYDSGGMNPTPNALSPEGVVYAHGVPAAAQGHEVLDPSGNGGNFFYKDFDFSYL